MSNRLETHEGKYEKKRSFKPSCSDNSTVKYFLIHCLQTCLLVGAVGVFMHLDIFSVPVVSCDFGLNFKS